MSFDDELARRLAESAELNDPAPDLAWVEAEARRHVSRRRRPAALGTVAVIALAVGTGLYLGTGSDDSGESASEALVSMNASTATSGPVTSPEPGDSALEPIDAAAPFIDRTVEIYRRTVADREIVVRRSELSWAELFGLEWRAPTGSTELCMGDYALFVGDSAMGRPYSGSAWMPIEVFDAFEGEVAVDMSSFELTVVRTSGSADEVAVVANGSEYDRAAFVDGLAVLDLAGLWAEPQPGEPELVLVADGVSADPLPFEPRGGRGSEEYQRDCTPGPAPQLPLPPAGEPPADPVAAEAEIVDAYARALDRSVPLALENPPSVDDITGMAEAAAEVDAGDMADIAASAEHSIDELVFTAPGEAWFRYTITVDSGTLSGRYGIARFNGSVWQITRDTICQDLALAGGNCVPASAQNQPPEPPGWTETLAEYERTANLYWAWDCLPPPYGPGACDELSGGLGD